MNTTLTVLVRYHLQLKTGVLFYYLEDGTLRWYDPINNTEAECSEAFLRTKTAPLGAGCNLKKEQLEKFKIFKKDQKVAIVHSLRRLIEEG